MTPRAAHTVERTAVTTLNPPFAPYGWMPNGQGDKLPESMPSRFRNEDGTPCPASSWVAWLDSHANRLASFLWPRWANGGWQGAISPEDALDLIQADLQLMGPLSARLDAHVGQATATHRELFHREDEGPPQVSDLFLYAPAADDALVLRFNALLIDGGVALAAPASLELKQRMQRPRPYQVSFILHPDKRHVYEVAHTATTPSMVCGHCLQGALALADIVVRFEIESGRPLGHETLIGLQQFLVDSGDRRVFAGVHYPSDNLSSWYTALRYCRRLEFTPTEDPAQIRWQRTRAREVLWAAVQLSAVHAAMVAQGAPYLRALQILESEAMDPLP